MKVIITLFDLYKNYRPFYFFFLIFVFLLLIGIPLTISGHTIAGMILILSAVILLAAGIVLDSIKNQTLQILEEVLNQYELNDK